MSKADEYLVRIREQAPRLDEARGKGLADAADRLEANALAMRDLGQRSVAAAATEGEWEGLPVVEWLSWAGGEMTRLAAGGEDSVSGYYTAELCMRFLPRDAEAEAAGTALADLRHDLLILAEGSRLLASYARGGSSMTAAAAREMQLGIERFFGE